MIRHGISSAQSWPPTSSDSFGMRSVSTSAEIMIVGGIVVEARRQPFDVQRIDIGLVGIAGAARRRHAERQRADDVLVAPVMPMPGKQAVRKLLQRDRRRGGAAHGAAARHQLDAARCLACVGKRSARGSPVIAPCTSAGCGPFAALRRCSASDSASVIWSGSCTQKCIIAVGRPHFHVDWNSCSVWASAEPCSTIADASISWSMVARIPRRPTSRACARQSRQGPASPGVRPGRR